MRFARAEWNDRVDALLGHADEGERAVGENWRLEENVSEDRQRAFETLPVNDLKTAAQAYFDASVQGTGRDHASSTFDPAVNDPALLGATVDPNQKIVRLEQIDFALSKEGADGGGLTYERLAGSLPESPERRLLAEAFQQFANARPAFAAFRAEMAADLKRDDWLLRVIRRLGLIHLLPAAGQTLHFALMEYTAKEVLAQARAAATPVDRPFALATVLEARWHAAFHPVPAGSANGFAVDICDDPKPAMAQEVLHVRFDYEPRHVVRFGWLAGPIAVTGIAGHRRAHRRRLRSDAGCAAFAWAPEDTE
ncbi:MAG: hypothetical protein GVY28_05835 [Alphaproteobacteria bacterium]|jgi:hypothetical protein|nr:hypothetical protein [Alphaproteobacteria bacterium]